MTRALALTLVLASALFAMPTNTSAQLSGVAFAEFMQGPPLMPGGGFVGPFRGTATGIELHMAVLCMNLNTRVKVPREVTVAVPDGASLTEMRTLSTTAVVAGCAEYDITVPRGAVLLPAMNLGL